MVLKEIGKEELSKVLDMFSIKFLRRISYQKGLEFKSVSKEPIIKKLLELDWSDDEVLNLKKVIREIKTEKEGISKYIMTYESAQKITEIQSKIAQNLCQKGSNGTRITKDGFGKVTIHDHTGIIESDFWKYSSKAEITPEYEFDLVEKNIRTPFIIDTKSSKIIIETHSQGYASSTRKFISEKLKLDINSSGITDLSPAQTKTKFEALVTSLEKVCKRE